MPRRERPRPTRPVPWRAAFGRTDRPAILSQAALLLLLGAQLRADQQALRARAAAMGRQRFVDAIPSHDAAEFAVPRLRPLQAARIPVGPLHDALVRRYGRRFSRSPLTEARTVPMDLLADLAGRLRRTPTTVTAAELIEACLRHPHELVRVAGAAAYFRLTADPARLLPVIEQGTQSTEELVRDVAATALGRFAPDHPRLAELTRGGPPPTGGAPAHTSLLVHGTFARTAAWWQPGGDFHAYLLANVRPDLYGGGDRFEWSGGYSDAARAVAANDLSAWVAAHNVNGLDLFTHSHGGSVAMLASHQPGMTIGELVLLSCPVHVDQYLPNFGQVTKVVSIHVHLDLVILLDGGGQRFRHPQIAEHVLPVWFDHSATHDPDVWQTYDVPHML